jgi:hypothetical protein
MLRALRQSPADSPFNTPIRVHHRDPLKGGKRPEVDVTSDSNAGADGSEFLSLAANN